MKNLEGGIVVAFGAVIILKMLQIQGAGLLTLMVLSLISVFFVAGSWRLFLPKTPEKDHKVIALITGIAFSIATIAILFKVQVWPGTQGMLSIALTGIGIAAITTLVYFLSFRSTSQSPFYKQMLSRILIVAILTSVFYFVPTRSLIKIYHRGDREYVRLFMQAHDNPQNESFQQELMQYRKSKRQAESND